MQPQAAAPLSLARAGLDDPDSSAKARPNPAGAAAFHKAFSKAHARPRPEQSPPPPPVAERAKRTDCEPANAGGASRDEAAPAEHASTVRRPGTKERQDANGPERQIPDEGASAANADDKQGSATPDAGSSPDATRLVTAEDTSDPTGTDPSLLALLQPQLAAQTVATKAPVDFASLFANGLAANGLVGTAPLANNARAGRALAIDGQAAKTPRLTGDEGTTGLGSDLGGASAATLHSLADALAKADHASSGAGATPGRAATLASADAAIPLEAPRAEVTSVSPEARALVDGVARQQSQRVATAALESTNTAAIESANNAAPLAKEQGDSGSSHAATTASEARISGDVAGPDGGRSAGDAGGGSSDSTSQDDRGNGASAFRDARITDGFERTDGAAAKVQEHGAFGLDTRTQPAQASPKSIDARAEQVRASTERILQQIERITDQRNVGRDMVIATERGPVRVRIEVTDKQVNVNFRAEDDQLKNMLRSGLPALQASLERRGFAQNSFRFDGDASSDLMAGSGSGKHLEARAARESLLGEAMVETHVAANVETKKVDPRSLLSVVA